jgi:polyisoprenoid-binding protein YceI
MLRTKFLYFIPGMALLALACVGPQHGPGPGALKLDPAQSTLTATAIKNGVKPVAVHFPGLSGWADPSAGTAELAIPLATLATGDLTRDYNVRTLFFEVGKLASYATADFTLDKVDADVSALQAGVAVSTLGHGTLELHGASLHLDGPLEIVKDGPSIKVVLGKGWVVAIDKTSLTQALVNLNKNCPQPHHVGNDVTLSGELVFNP